MRSLRRSSYLGRVVTAPSRRTPPPVAGPPVTRDDLSELDSMRTPGWSLDNLLADYPGWPDRGMSEVEVLGR